MANENPLIIIIGPSGVGKDELCNRAKKTFPELGRVVTATTRKPRLGEVDGVNYHFMWWPLFLFRALFLGYFVEYQKIHGNWYGTPRAGLDRALAKGPVMLQIDYRGAHKIWRAYPHATPIFIDVPEPSLETLRKRLVKRDGESEAINTRLETAKDEFKHKHEFPHRIVNDVLDKADDELTEIIGLAVSPITRLDQYSSLPSN